MQCTKHACAYTELNLSDLWTPIRVSTKPYRHNAQKGDLSQYGSYCGISLMSCTTKLFNWMLLNCIHDPIEKFLRPNQNGFQNGRSTMEPILALRWMIEAISAKKDKRLCAIFVDFIMAFDSINRDHMFLILVAYGIQSAIINAIRCVYTNSKSFVSTHDGDTETFAVNTGILKGYTLAPFLFIIVHDYVLWLCATLNLELPCDQFRDLDAQLNTLQILILLVTLPWCLRPSRMPRLFYRNSSQLQPQSVWP